jgi:hypothetical protein
VRWDSGGGGRRARPVTAVLPGRREFLQVARVISFRQVGRCCQGTRGLPCGRTALLFQIFTDREERRAIAVASNAPFSEWQKTFTDQRLCSAIVDRLTFNGHIIETGTDSYRLRSTQERLRARA